MLYSREKKYIENAFYKGFLKPYKGSDYSFMALLPGKKSSSFMKRALKELDFSGLFREATDTKVDVSIPEFTCDDTIQLTKLLGDMGIKTLFSSRADFSPMSAGPLKMESIIHKAHIEVDKRGTKAAAVTMGFVAGCAPVMEEIKRVYLNRPFIYAIIHHETGLPVFAGIIDHLV